MEGASMKLALFVVLMASASFVIIPYAAEARGKKHAPPPPKSCTPPPPASAPAPAPAPNVVVPPPYQIHGCGYNCSDSNDCDAPCTICCANQTCCYDEPMVVSPPPPPPPPVVVVSPAPAPAPYQIRGCGHRCSDSNDCDWPCTLCCWQNQTCCHDLPMDGLTQTHI